MLPTKVRKIPTLELVLGLAILVSSDVGARSEDRSSGGVTLHRDVDYQGVSETFYADVPDLRGSRVGNDRVSSVSLGRDCQASLYADVDFKGLSIEISFGVADLRGTRIGNDALSSIRVRCEDRGTDWGTGGDGWSGAPPDSGVTLFRDLNFSGTSQLFTEDVPDLRDTFLGNDAATSVRVDRGCRARLYVDADYRGAYIEVDRQLSDLRGSRVGNDSVTSVRVRCDGRGAGWDPGDDGWSTGPPDYGVTLFRDLVFSGSSQTFTEDTSDLRDTFLGNDSATSVRISRGCRARLYADADFRGPYIEVERDVSDLRGSQVGNDAITSLQVRCEDRGGDWGSGDSGSSGTHRVTLYQHTNYRGNAYSFDSDASDLRTAFGANDEASSMQIAPGCTVRLFQDPGYRGAYTETTEDIPDLRSSRVGNDSVSSLQVRCR